MTRLQLFWISMLIAVILLVLGVFGVWNYGLIGSNLFLFWLIGLLGWQVYGPAIKG